ncbi:MAG: hypothetical protein U0Q15_03860 [Kineosporiaceae bacterium]
MAPVRHARRIGVVFGQRSGSVVVPVTDGLLTLSTGAGGSNVKLNAVTAELQ